MTISVPVTQALLQSLSHPAQATVGLSRYDDTLTDCGASDAALVQHLIRLAEDAHAVGQAELAARLVEIAQDLMDARFEERQRSALAAA